MLVAKGCPRLETLYMSDVEAMDDMVLTELTCRCTGLREVYLRGCSGVTDSGVGRLRGLTSVALCFNSRVTDASIESLLHRCERLEYVEVVGCPEVTEGCLTELRERVGRVEAV